MSTVTIKAVFDSSGVRAGLTALKGEANNFRATFNRGIERGGGFFGSLDAALGKLATGRFAGPIAAVGAALAVARVTTEAMSKNWENMASSTERALQNIQAIEATRSAVMGQKYAGEAMNTQQERELASKQGAAAKAAGEAGEFGDPSTFAGRAKTAKELGGGGITGFYHYLMLTGGALGVPGMGGAYDAANELYNQRQARANETRQAADQAAQLNPFVQYANRSQQRAAQGDLQSAVDRLGVAQGRATNYEASQRKALLAHAQYQDTLRTYSNNENDPRVMQAKAAALDAFTTFDTEATQARRFRNDPTISADSLARLGGGGTVGVFGQGRGELLFEQKRLNSAIAGLTQVMRDLNATVSRGASNDVRQ